MTDERWKHERNNDNEQTINKWLLRQQWQWWNDQQMIMKKQRTNHQQTITMTTRWSTCRLQNEDNDDHDDYIMAWRQRHKQRAMATNIDMMQH